jgi:hypothetical protein
MQYPTPSGKTWASDQRDESTGEAMMNLFAIDPGPTQSGCLLCETHPFKIVEVGIFNNTNLLADILRRRWRMDLLLIEQIMMGGMIAGQETFETCFVSGQFAQAVSPTPFARMGRIAIKMHLCGSARAKDANVRQALIDKFGPGREVAVGTKKHPGHLYGVHSHTWAALALAVAYAETHVDAPSWEERHDALVDGVSPRPSQEGVRE